MPGPSTGKDRTSVGASWPRARRISSPLTNGDPGARPRPPPPLGPRARPLASGGCPRRRAGPASQRPLRPRRGCSGIAGGAAAASGGRRGQRARSRAPACRGACSPTARSWRPPSGDRPRPSRLRRGGRRGGAWRPRRARRSPPMPRRPARSRCATPPPLPSPRLAQLPHDVDPQRAAAIVPGQLAEELYERIDVSGSPGGGHPLAGGLFLPPKLAVEQFAHPQAVT